MSLQTRPTPHLLIHTITFCYHYILEALLLKVPKGAEELPSPEAATFQCAHPHTAL